MRLSEIRIENFRSFDDKTIILDDYTCLVGPNGAGKSTILCALNIFFRNTASSSTNVVTLSEEDFHHRKTDKPIKITLTFEDLSPEAQKDFKAYYRNGKLIVSAKAVWSKISQSAEVKQYGSRDVMADFVPFFKAFDEKASAADLNEIYSKLQENYSDLPKATSKDAKRDALREYEEALPELCELVEGEQQFYGWSKGSNILKKRIQWVFVPAVKDATTEQEESRATALGQLLERTIRSKVNFENPISELKRELEEKYKKLIDKEQSILDGLTSSLTSRLQSWAHSNTKVDLKWHYNEDKSIVINEPHARVFVGEHGFIGELARLGHGLQRSFLVSLLQELAESGDENAPKLLLGFEEPELYQHPPQAKHMAGLLEQLSSKEAQIIITTHSPYFVSGKGFENIRMVRDSRGSKSSVVTRTTHKQVSEMIGDALKEEPRSPTSMMAAIEQIMQPSQNELFFTNYVILVEGLEDLAFISTYLKLTGKWDAFQGHGCHFVVTDGKTNLSRPLAIANGLGIPVFVVFDSDADKPEKNTARDNACILSLCGVEKFDPLPAKTLWEKNVVMWPSKIAKVVMEDLGAEWVKMETQARKDHGLEDGVNRKNSLLIVAVLEQLWKQGKRSSVLDKLCESILTFAEEEGKR